MYLSREATLKGRQADRDITESMCVIVLIYLPLIMDWKFYVFVRIQANMLPSGL